MHQFSIAHLAALTVSGLAAGFATWAPRRYPGRWIRWAAWAIAMAVFAGWAGEYVADVVEGIWTARYGLPLQLTDAVSLTAILALLTRRQPLIELLYFWAFSASLQAVLTPDISNTFPNVFYFTYFLYHVGSIVAAFLLVFGLQRYPRRGAIWRVYMLTLGWTALAALGDLITGGNYMYLASKPIHNSVLNVMGPWPFYIASAAVLGLIIFLALNAIAGVARRIDNGRSETGRHLLTRSRSTRSA